MRAATPGWTGPLRGITVPLVTPLGAPGRLDVAGTERLVEHVIAGGVRSIFVLGTTGEGPLLGDRFRRDFVDRVCRQVGGRVPVLVGITETVFARAIRLAVRSADSGASAVVAAPPFYLKPGPRELARYLRKLAEQSPLPLFLYNMPNHTRTVIDAEVIRQSLDLENVVGLKDSSGDMGYFHAARRLIAARPDWSLLVGPEHLMAESVRLGGHGGVNGGANVAPALFVELHRAAEAGDLARVDALQQRVLDLGRIYRVGRHESAVIKGIKCALSCLGLCDDAMTVPFGRFAASGRARIGAILEESGLLAAGGPTTPATVSHESLG